MTLLPIFLRLEGRPVVVIGAGTVALAKIESVLPTGAQLTVIAPTAVDRIHSLARERKVTLRTRPFSPVDLDGALLVIAATNNSAVNHAVYEEALRRNILCNAVDDPPNCDFYFGSIVSRGDLQIAVSTAGESPALAQRLRREIDEQLPSDLGPWIQQLGALRREIRERAPATAARTQLLNELVHRPLCESPGCPTRKYARQQIERLQASSEVLA